MQALVFEEFGAPEVLHAADLPDPAERPGCAVVQLEAAGLNFADVYRRRGAFPVTGRPPYILGYEGAGVIDSLGSGDPGGLAVGQRVGFADVAHANAELVSAPFERLIPLPADIPASTAAAVLLQGLTAQALVEETRPLRRGEVVLVHAAAGGVGLLLVQLVRAAGARVVALASRPEKRDAARSAGADLVLADDGDWVAAARDFTGGAGVDVVYDSVGSTLVRSLEVARTGGAVVFFGFAGGEPPPVGPRTLMDRSLSLLGADLWNVLTSGPARRTRAARLFDRLRSGTLRVQVARTFPLSQGAAAHRFLEGRSAIGKTLLLPEGRP